MNAWSRLWAFLVWSGSPYIITDAFVSPGFGWWTVIAAPDICKVNILSLTTMNTSKWITIKKIKWGCKRSSYSKISRIQEIHWSKLCNQIWIEHQSNRKILRTSDDIVVMGCPSILHYFNFKFKNFKMWKCMFVMNNVFFLFPFILSFDCFLWS